MSERLDAPVAPTTDGHSGDGHSGDGHAGNGLSTDFPLAFPTPTPVAPPVIPSATQQARDRQPEPVKGLVGPREGARPRSLAKSRSRGLAVALVLAVVAVAVGVWSLQRTDQALRRVDQAGLELEASRQQVAALDGRIAELEADAARRPDPALTAERVRASVFTIISSTGRGSAWVAGAEEGRSLLVTNFHVVGPEAQPGTAVTVVREDLRIDGEVVRIDKDRDLAVVAVDQALESLPIAEELPRVGDPVMVVGSPLGLEQSVVGGIVSALRGEHIQISAPLNPGNSGGPVVDAEGRVIGVAVLKVGDENTEAIGLAIPASEVCTVVAC